MRRPDDPRFTSDRYAFSEAGRILGVQSQTVGNWFRGYRRGAKHYGPLFGQTLGVVKPRSKISYLELVEAKIVAACRSHGISAVRIRRAREFAQVHLDAEFPFATRQFTTDGSRVLYEFQENEEGRPDGPMFVDIGSAAAQTVLPGYIREVVDLFEFATDGVDWPTCFYPRGRDVPLSVDPTFRSGQVTIVNRGIPAESVWRRWLAEEPRWFIAQDLEIDLTAVDAAIAFRSAA